LYFYSLSLEGVWSPGAYWSYRVRVYPFEIGDKGFERKPKGEKLGPFYNILIHSLLFTLLMRCN
jgi:hypothetical protein